MSKYGEPLPDNVFEADEPRPWVSACIDDNVLQSEVPLTSIHKRDPGSQVEELAEKVLRVYDEVGLRPKESKVKMHGSDAKALGTEILGTRG